MDIVSKNPYRYLGVFSNSPTKERVANKGKMKAFLKVGKPVSFPIDLPNILPVIDRTVESVANAESELALQIDQIRFAQFWWMKSTAIDDVAFNNLMSGNVEMAKSIWSKKDNVSSLQNRFLLSVIYGDITSAIRYAENLYSNFSEDFIMQVLGDNMPEATPLWQLLIDSFIDEDVDLLHFSDVVEQEEWKIYIADKTINPLIDIISEAIDMAKYTKGKGSAARLKAGQKMISTTKVPLSELKKILPCSDIRYQTIADKLATEILQCGIDYFNDADDYDAPHKAMELQDYALSIAVGSMVKQRCKENVNILKKIIDELPPAEVMPQYRAIIEELRKYIKLPDEICHAISLLNATKPHLNEMKSIIGSSNSVYIKLSTQVVGNALHNVIEEVNDVQKKETVEFQRSLFSMPLLLDRDTKIALIKSVLQNAWNATKIMDTFDMEAEFKANRYMGNRRILKNLCRQFGISTSESNIDKEMGCMVAIIIVVLSVVLAMIIGG